MEAGHDKILFEDLEEKVKEDFEILEKMEKLVSENNKDDPKRQEELKRLISKAKDSKNKLLQMMAEKLERGLK